MERSNSTKYAQKKHHGTTTTRRSRKNGGKQEALALTGYSASYRHKTRGVPQEPSSSCGHTAYRAPGRRSAPPLDRPRHPRNTLLRSQSAYFTIYHTWNRLCTSCQHRDFPSDELASLSVQEPVSPRLAKG